MPKPSEPTVVGHRVVGLRAMTREEARATGWSPRDADRAMVLILDDGTYLFASQDEEGNGPGALFGVSPDGEAFRLVAPPRPTPSLKEQAGKGF